MLRKGGERRKTEVNPNSMGKVLRWTKISADSIIDNLPPDRFPSVYLEKYFKDLVDSIAEFGQLRPIIVRESHGTYEIAAGRLRLEACRRLGRKVDAQVRELDDIEMMRVQYWSNEYGR